MVTLGPNQDRATYEYEGDQLVRVRQTGAGGFSATIELEYEGGRESLRVTRTRDGVGDPVVITTTYGYDEHGRVAWEQSLCPNPLIESTKLLFTRNAAGQVTRRDVDRRADGTVDSSGIFTLDAQGRRLGFEEREGERLVQTCRYDEPCPAPFLGCPRTCERAP
jgi:hypothetical protein